MKGSMYDSCKYLFGFVKGKVEEDVIVVFVKFMKFCIFFEIFYWEERDDEKVELIISLQDRKKVNVELWQFFDDLLFRKDNLGKYKYSGSDWVGILYLGDMLILKNGKWLEKYLICRFSYGSFFLDILR